MGKDTNKTLIGKVIKHVAARFVVLSDNKRYKCIARKKIRGKEYYQDAVDEILVGDIVEFVKDRDVFIIEKVQKRKNQLIRPYVSNIDTCLIVISPIPEPDFLLVDKIIVNCLHQNIEPILVLNKIDLGKIDVSDYVDLFDVIYTSTETQEGIQTLLYTIKGKTTCLAGQSAVGKSSIINAIMKNNVQVVGDISEGTQKGKNTTRITEIISIDKDTFIVDTCGFSMLETIDIQPEELRLYYDEFVEFSSQCKYTSCTHINEPDCEVRKHVGKEISSKRYNRYVVIFNELMERRKERYE